MKEDWAVEKLVDKRKGSNGSIEYLVRWEKSWISEAKYKQLRSCVFSVVAREHHGRKKYLVEWVDTWVDSQDIGEELINSYEESVSIEEEQGTPLEEEDQEPENIIDAGDPGGLDILNEDDEEEYRTQESRRLSPEDVQELVQYVLSPSERHNATDWYDFSSSLRGVKLKNLIDSGIVIPYILKNKATHAQRFICPRCFNVQNKSVRIRMHVCDRQGRQGQASSIPNFIKHKYSS